MSCSSPLRATAPTTCASSARSHFPSLSLRLGPALLERHRVMEKQFALGETPASALAPILVLVVSRGRDALAVAREARLDSAGAMRLVAVHLDNVILDKRDRDLR